MKKTTQYGRTTLSAVAGITMVVSMVATPAVAMADDAAQGAAEPVGGTEVQANSATVGSAQVTEAEVAGEFAFDQTTITPNAVIKTFFQKATQAICGA